MNAEAIRQQISNLLITYPELAEDDVLRADMIEAETEAHEFLRMVERRRRNAAFMAGGIAAEIAELGLRQERLERREKAMRALAFKVLDAMGQKKLELPEATYSIRDGQQTLMGDCDPENMPDDFCRIKRELDRTKIKEALKAGGTITGFILSNGNPTLSIRTK